MKIIELEIKNVRGIKELILTPDKNNFVVWGTNGSGKSAVVDAIDFLLTGQIHRLLGEGTRGITLRKHGAHIDCDDLSQAYVRAVISLEGIKQPVEIQRCMHDPDQLICPPESVHFLRPIVEIAERGQHVLTRREILKFITSTGGDRAKDIQALMNLTDIEIVRGSLVSVKNGLVREAKTGEKVVRRSEAGVATRVGIRVFDNDELIKIVNHYRAVLKGDPISVLSVEQLQVNINPPITVTTKPVVNVSVFESNVGKLALLTLDEAQALVRQQDENLRGLVAGIHEDAHLLRSFASRNLISAGLEALDESGKCPLCDTQWEPGELEALLTSKLASAAVVEKRVNQISQVADKILQEITKISSTLGSVINAVKIIGLAEELAILQDWQAGLETLEISLEDPVGKYHQPPFSVEQVQRLLTPENINAVSGRILDTAKAKYPKSTPEQTAWDTLTKLSVDLKQLEDAHSNYENSILAAKRANILHDEFIASRDQILGKLYAGIKDRFVEMYRDLHSDSEGDFDASLEPSEASLEFEVDFFGRGTHPPHALHSEGHQDSMGVCLFLALSEKLTHGLINLIILDDVMMSVDANHRRELCGVLTKYFPNHQFLITTHDKTWVSQLRFNGIVKSNRMYEFFDWNLDSGPKVNDVVYVWDRIAKDMENGDIPSAAAKLRRGSEQFFAEACGNLAASPPYSADGRYELGDLMGAAMSRFKELLTMAQKAAITWNPDKAEVIQVLSSKRKAIYSDLGKEQWAVNVNVHYNDWADFTKNDFQPVIDQFKALHNLFICQNCGGMISLISTGKTPKNVRCPCNQVNWNLEKKKHN